MPEELGCGVKYDPAGVDSVRLSRDFGGDGEGEGRLTRDSVNILGVNCRFVDCVLVSDVEFLRFGMRDGGW